MKILHHEHVDLDHSREIIAQICQKNLMGVWFALSMCSLLFHSFNYLRITMGTPQKFNIPNMAIFKKDRAPPGDGYMGPTEREVRKIIDSKCHFGGIWIRSLKGTSSKSSFWVSMLVFRGVHQNMQPHSVYPRKGVVSLDLIPSTDPLIRSLLWIANPLRTVIWRVPWRLKEIHLGYIKPCK